jgi:hypothetical protein
MEISGKIWASQAKKPQSQATNGSYAASYPTWKDSVCFEKGARMDSFAAVLSTPSYSSMYVCIYMCEGTNPLLISNDYNSHDMYACKWFHFVSTG